MLSTLCVGATLVFPLVDTIEVSDCLGALGLNFVLVFVPDSDCDVCIEFCSLTRKLQSILGESLLINYMLCIDNKTNCKCSEDSMSVIQ